VKKIKTVTGKVIAESKAKGMTIKKLAEKHRNKLAYADLSGVNLFYVNLSYSDLFCIDLSNSELAYADLSNSDLTGADLTDANLFCANLSFDNLDNTKLTGIKGYSDSYEIFFELCRRQSIKTFTSKEWMIIGQLSLHYFCWDVIKRRYGKTALSIAKKLAKAGWDEYYKKYKEILK